MNPRRKGNRNRRPFKKEELHRINEKIKIADVRLVGDNVEQGVFSTVDAIEMAQKQELDLVEISPKAVPPVCRIIDYKKFLYQQKKKQKEIKSKTVKVVVKEIKVFYQKLTTSSCFLLLFFHEILGCFIILLSLVIIVDIICIILKTHIIIDIVPTLIYSIDHLRVLAIIISSSVILVVNELVLGRKLVLVDVIWHQTCGEQ